MIRLVRRWWEFALLAIRNLLGYPLRSMLTTLGVVIGIASVVVMLAVGEGAQAEILREIDKMGISNVIINSVKPPEDSRGSTQRRWISNYGVKFADLEQITETVPGVARALPVHEYTERAWIGSTKQEVIVRGVTPAHFEVAKLRVAEGRALNDEDERQRRNVCVVNLALLRGMGHYGQALGYRLLVGKQVYTVVGVLETKEFMGFARKALSSPERGENELYAPYSTVLTRVGTVSVSRASGSFSGSNVELNQLILEAQSKDHVKSLARMVKTVLEQSHEDRDYEIVVPEQLLEQRRKTQQVFSNTLLAIAGISLLVGGIGIANIMLATVTERTREIGVRRAIGAKRKHIISQFLSETVILAILGGVIGVLVGGLLILLAEWQLGWEAYFSPSVAVLAVAISCGVGILSGLFPAWKASRLDPIRALRYE